MKKSTITSSHVIVSSLVALTAPCTALADCVYTGSKRAYVECIYAEVVSVTAQLGVTAAEVLGLDVRLTAVEGDVSFLDAALLTVSDGLSSLSDTLDTLALQVTALGSDVDAVELDIADHEARLAALEARVDALEVAPALGTEENPAVNCQELYDAGETESALYWLSATVGGSAYPTYCEMGFGGGWTLILKGDVNTTASPLSWYNHNWWTTWAGIGSPDDAVFAVENAEHFVWSSMLVKSGASSLRLNSGASASLASGSHGSLVSSNAVGGVIPDGTTFHKNTHRQSGNALVMRDGRWLSGSCDSTECHGTHGLGVMGANHGGAFYAQASSMFQTYSYNTGTPETLAVYVR